MANQREDILNPSYLDLPSKFVNKHDNHDNLEHAHCVYS